MSARFLCVVLVLFILGANGMAQGKASRADPPYRYWKGNIHTHSLWSDGNDFPEMIAEIGRVHPESIEKVIRSIQQLSSNDDIPIFHALSPRSFSVSLTV